MSADIGLLRWQQCAGMCLICGQPLGVNTKGPEKKSFRRRKHG